MSSEAIKWKFLLLSSSAPSFSFPLAASVRALSSGGSWRGSSTVTHPCLGRGFLLALLARSLTTDARFGEILESLGGFRAGWSLGTIRRHGPGEVLAMGSCWDVPPTLGQSSPAPACPPLPFSGRSPPPLLLALAPLREDRVDLVDEDHGGLLGARHAEERADELLALAHPLGHERRRRDVEEGRLRVGRDRLGDERLARSRRTEEDKTPLFSSELQDQLLDVTFSFTEDLRLYMLWICDRPALTHISGCGHGPWN